MSDENRKATVAPGLHDNGENRPGYRLWRELRHSFSRSWRAPPMGTQPLMCIMALLTMLALGAGNASTQQTAVCSETPGTGERVECTQPDTSSDDISLILQDIDIDTTESDAHGVYGHHEGAGRIFIDIQTGLAEGGGLIRNDIDTTGDDANGVYARHVGSGNIDIGGQNLHITTAGEVADGVLGFIGYDPGFPPPIDSPPPAAGNVRIGVFDSTIETTGYASRGVTAENHGGAGRTDINVSNSTITTLWDSYGAAHGIFALRQGTTTGDATVTVADTNITTKSYSGMGINVDHQGEDTANIIIDVELGRIDTANSNGYAIRGFRSLGAGNVDIDVVGTLIETAGRGAYGIFGYMYENNGDIDVYAEDIDLTTTGDQADGIQTWFQSSDNTHSGDILVDVRGGSITTKGAAASGLYSFHDGAGNIDIDVRNLEIKTENTGNSNRGIFGWHKGDGDIDIDVLGGSSITTAGTASYGIYGLHQGDGDIDIAVQDATITTESTDLGSYDDTFSLGIYAYHLGTGDIDIDLLGGSVTTKGVYSYGVYGRHSGAGDIAIDTRDGNTITTTGDNAHGIVAYHYGTEASRTIDVTVGGRIDAGGAGAHGVRVGTVNADGEAERVAAVGADGYLQQTVTVNGSVMGDAAGVFLAGGGKVFIGPAGTVGAESGIAVLASGGAPKLYFDMNLDGRRVAEVIGDDWIINDGGETTIVVNDVKLHDGATGVVPGASAPNGAFDVTVKDDGLTVTDRSTSPWTFSQRSTSTIADRDFSAEDFTETMPPPPPPMCPPGQVGTPPDCTTPPPPMCPPGQVGTPPDCTTPPPPMCPPGQVGTPPDCTTPPPPMCPPGQVGTPPDCTTPPLEQTTTEPETDVEPIMPPTFTEEYAPRAAVYEAMPGFLLRIDAPELTEERIAWVGSPVWTRLSGGRGSYEPERASVGAQFDYSRFAAEAGLDVSLGENATGSVSVRHVKGSAEVSAPTGGGKIEAEGLGFSLGASLNSANDYYARGRISLTSYSVDLSSDALGSLKKGVGASVNSLNFEAGRRMAASDKMSLTPRVWMMRSQIDMDDFTDIVDARMSLGDAARLVVGGGVAGETALDWQGGALTLRGSVDLAQTLGGAETSVEVSGTKLSSEALKSRLLLGLGGTYRRGSFFLDAEVSVGGLGSGDAQYSGRVTYGWRF